MKPDMNHDALEPENTSAASPKPTLETTELNKTELVTEEPFTPPPTESAETKEVEAQDTSGGSEEPRLIASSPVLQTEPPAPRSSNWGRTKCSQTPLRWEHNRPECSVRCGRSHPQLKSDSVSPGTACADNAHDRPRLSFLRPGSGNSGSINSHCSSVTNFSRFFMTEAQQTILLKHKYLD
jgi:hypothetical protein